MSQLTIKLSTKADALIAQLQKEIFNRRRKKISPAGVVETLVESGAKSQSDKRFATSWTNLIKDIGKAAKLVNTHGNKPPNLTNEEWALVLTHRSRQARSSSEKNATTIKQTAKKSTTKSTKNSKSKTLTRKTTIPKSSSNKSTTKSSNSSTSHSGIKATKKKSNSANNVARRIAKATGQIGSKTITKTGLTSSKRGKELALN